MAPVQHSLLTRQFEEWKNDIPTGSSRNLSSETSACVIEYDLIICTSVYGKAPTIYIYLGGVNPALDIICTSPYAKAATMYIYSWGPSVNPALDV